MYKIYVYACTIITTTIELSLNKILLTIDSSLTQQDIQLTDRRVVGGEEIKIFCERTTRRMSDFLVSSTATMSYDKTNE